MGGLKKKKRGGGRNTGREGYLSQKTPCSISASAGKVRLSGQTRRGKRLDCSGRVGAVARGRRGESLPQSLNPTRSRRADAGLGGRGGVEDPRPRTFHLPKTRVQPWATRGGGPSSRRR